MLSNERIKEVMQLLDAGQHSQRQIAKITGVSRIVIYRIVAGKRKIRPTAKNATWDEDHISPWRLKLVRQRASLA